MNRWKCDPSGLIDVDIMHQKEQRIQDYRGNETTGRPTGQGIAQPDCVLGFYGGKRAPWFLRGDKKHMANRKKHSQHIETRFTKSGAQTLGGWFMALPLQIPYKMAFHRGMKATGWNNIGTRIEHNTLVTKPNQTSYKHPLSAKFVNPDLILQLW